MTTQYDSLDGDGWYRRVSNLSLPADSTDPEWAQFSTELIEATVTGEIDDKTPICPNELTFDSTKITLEDILSAQRTISVQQETSIAGLTYGLTIQCVWPDQADVEPDSPTPAPPDLSQHTHTRVDVSVSLGVSITPVAVWGDWSISVRESSPPTPSVQSPR